MIHSPNNNYLTQGTLDVPPNTNSHISLHNVEMGRGKPKTSTEKAKKPKTEIQVKREARRSRKAAPRLATVPTPSSSIPKEKHPPKPKPPAKNPGHAKWSAIFKRHLTVIETHIQTLDRTKQNLIASMNEMDDAERKRWETGEIGNWTRLSAMMDRAREILASGSEAASLIVCPILLYRVGRRESGNRAGC
jgi:hypothetical protein